jgi:lipase
VRLSVTEWGDPAGPPVLCLHGVTGHGRRFRRLAEERLGAHRVVGIDYRGHGRSGGAPPWDVETHVADLLETAEALAVEEAAWVGHSFGGRLVAEVAARHPDLVSRAILLDPALWLDPALCGERAELARADTSFGSADEAIEARLSDGSLFTTPRATLEQEAGEHLLQGADGRWRWQFVAGAVICAWSAMASPAPPWPSCETLVVLGERSWVAVDVPDRDAIEVVRVPGGHSVLWDDFDATADAIDRFLGPA